MPPNMARGLTMHSRHATPPLPIHNASSAIDARAHTVIAHTNTHAVIHSSRNTVCEYHQCGCARESIACAWKMRFVKLRWALPHLWIRWSMYMMRVGRKVVITCEQTQMAFILVPSSHDDDHARGHCWHVCAYTCNRNEHSDGRAR